MSKWVQPYVVVKAAQPSLGARLLRLFGYPQGPSRPGRHHAGQHVGGIHRTPILSARPRATSHACRKKGRALRPRRRHRTGEVCHCARDRAPAGAGCGLGLGGVVGDDGLSRIQRRMVLLRFARQKSVQPPLQATNRSPIFDMEPISRRGCLSTCLELC